MPNALASTAGASSWLSRGTPDARIQESPPSIVTRMESPVTSAVPLKKLLDVPTATPSRLLGKATAAIPWKRVTGISIDVPAISVACSVPSYSFPVEIVAA